MSLSLRPEHLRRYRDIAWLLWKHGRADWVTDSGLDKHVGEDFKEKKDDGAGPESLARDLEALGPTFVKIGQMLASRPDMLPPAYLDALGRLQDHVEPIPFEQIEEVINAELPARPSRVFSEIDPQPLAAASLAQVHKARLRDGRDVVIKVQRPGIQAEIARDFEVFASIAQLAKHTSLGKNRDLEEIVLEFKRTIEAELDYRLEVDNLRTLRRNLREFKHLLVPEPIPDFCSARVLTMERVEGSSIGSVSRVVFTELDTDALADELFAAYLKQILLDGFFHADPHPGNVFLTLDHRLALIDLGMVGRVDMALRQDLLQLLIAVSEGRGREAADVAVRIGTPVREFDRDAFFDRVSTLVMQIEDSTVKDIAAGKLVLQIQQIAADTGIKLPSALTLIGKTLLNLDTIGRNLAPTFNPNESIRKHSLQLVQRRLRDRLSPGNFLQSALEMTDLVSHLPRRINELLTQIGKSGIRLDVDAFDEATFVEGFQKVANRITTGLVLAALIIGAALLMRVETSFKLWGYPGLAMLLFLAAAIGGIVLLWQIMMSDRKKRD
jgi:predicted unusual protein kinase regulating ubiquinone biosynthesis (AarF/ABC1/UbiB family)